MKKLLSYLLLFLIVACNKQKDGVNPDGSIAFSQIKQRAFRNAETSLGQYFRDPNIDKDVFVFGLKNSEGYLKTIDYVMVVDSKTQDWILYGLNDDYLPKWMRLSKNYTLVFSDYNLANKTFTITTYQTDTQTQISVLKNQKLSDNALKWAEAARSNLKQDLRNARVAKEVATTQNMLLPLLLTLPSMPQVVLWELRNLVLVQEYLLLF